MQRVKSMFLQEILDFLNKKNIEYKLCGITEPDKFMVEGFSSLFNYKPGSMTFVAPERNFKDFERKFSNNEISLLIAGKNYKECSSVALAIVVADSRKVFFELLDGLFAIEPDESITGISDNPEIYKKYSYISEQAVIGKNVKIGVGCVIEGNVVIGDGTVIHHNVVIRNKTKIGKCCKINSGVVIGEYGFGYTVDSQGKKHMLKHYGGVTIEDNVLIGDNSCIIRGAIDDTLIKAGVKINTMVHIAHNDVVGENTIITMPTHVCGSVTIGKNCHIAGSMIRNQRTIGDNAMVGLGAIVVADVDEDTIVVGNPAKFMKKR